KQVELLHAVSLLDLPGRGAPASTTVIRARPGLSPREKKRRRITRAARHVSLEFLESPALHRRARGVDAHAEAVFGAGQEAANVWNVPDDGPRAQDDAGRDVDRGQAVEEQGYRQQRRRDDGSEGNVARYGDDDDEDDHQRQRNERRPAHQDAQGGGHAAAALELEKQRPVVARHHGQRGARDEQVAEAHLEGEGHARPPFGRIQKQHDQGRHRPQDAHDVGRADVAAAAAANVDARRDPAQQVAERDRPDDVATYQKQNRKENVVHVVTQSRLYHVFRRSRRRNRIGVPINPNASRTWFSK